MKEDIKNLSKANLAKLLKRVNKYKVKNTLEEVDVALKSLPIYHCVPSANIIEVIKTQTIKVKNQVIKGEHTNKTTDYFQGFENHLSMSAGKPWIEYGPHAFAYGLEHIHEDSLAFNEDPWLWKSHDFSKNVLTKQDFITYAKEMLLRNLYMISKKHYVKIPWNVNLHKLAEKNFSTWEIKQANNLSVLDAEEYFLWTNMDASIFMVVKLFSNKAIMLLFIIVLIIVAAGGAFF